MVNVYRTDMSFTLGTQSGLRKLLSNVQTTVQGNSTFYNVDQQNQVSDIFSLCKMLRFVVAGVSMLFCHTKTVFSLMHTCCVWAMCSWYRQIYYGLFYMGYVGMVSFNYNDVLLCMGYVGVVSVNYIMDCCVWAM